VAVTVESIASSRKGGGVAIKVIEAEISGDKSKKVVVETRVRFSVAISAPSTDLLEM
jgi:hypothetical protein